MKKLKIVLQSNLTYVLLILFIVIYIIFFTKIIKPDINISSNELEGIVTDIDINKDKALFILKNKHLIKCNYYYKDYDNIDNFKNLLGKKIKVFGTKKELYNNTIPNTFNYKKYLYNNKIYNVYQINNIEILENENIFYKLKNNIINKINNYPENIKIYLNLFILGDKSFLDETMYNNYRNNGIWHLFAVSGMHISLIIFVLNIIFKKIKFKNLIISLLLMYFMFLTNFSASVMRATIFFYIKNILNFWNIKINNKKILFLTAIIILIINPFTIYNIGFQYSFLITYAIMNESNKITGNYFIKILKISIISVIVSFPITINMNYEFNLLSIILNVFYVPFISFIVFPLSIITFIFPVFSFLLKIFIEILEYTNIRFNSINLNIIVPKMSVFIVFLYYLVLYIYKKCQRKIYLLCLLLIIVFNIFIKRIDNNKYVYYFDVSQGDSILYIDHLNSDTIMIDTGGLINSSYHVSDNIILFLKSIGISKINSLLLTHGDFDHMGEAINLVENFEVEKVIFNCGEFNKLEEDLIKILEKKKIPYDSCIKELNIDDNKLYFLNNKDYGDENDNSSVMYTKINNYKFLFMGDAGVEVEQDLIKKYNLQDIDVLKVGHHGSRTSSSKEFIDEINPEYSIISVGKNNRYGHPNKGVLNNLNNSKIYRTDQDGSIMFKIKNNKLGIETCSP